MADLAWKGRTIGDLVDASELYVSTNPSGQWLPAHTLVELNSSTDPNDLVLETVVPHQDGRPALMLIGERVTVHLYGNEQLLSKLHPLLELNKGKNWQELRQLILDT
jgi:hypothetical protein